LGLKFAFENFPEVETIVRMLIALALVPAERVPEAMTVSYILDLS
jgi:hypothetical protein